MIIVLSILVLPLMKVPLINIYYSKSRDKYFILDRDIDVYENQLIIFHIDGSTGTAPFWRIFF